VVAPPGLIFHAGIGEGADFFTVTVWESQDADDTFAPTFARVMRAKAGYRFGPPNVLSVQHFLPPSATYCLPHLSFGV